MRELYFGDNLSVLGKHGRDASVDLMYLDPPFNSIASYNVLFKSPKSYESRLQIEGLMMAAPDTPEGERLDVLVTLVEAWERTHYPMELPDPVEAIKFEMERRGLTVKDLEPLIGRPNRVYEVLAHKRPLTLRMIWNLHRALGIPAENLIRTPPDYGTARQPGPSFVEWAPKRQSSN